MACVAFVVGSSSVSSGGGGSGGGIKTMYGEADEAGYITGNLPTLTPAGQVAIFIDNAGQQYQYFGGAWH